MTAKRLPLAGAAMVSLAACAAYFAASATLRSELAARMGLSYTALGIVAALTAVALLAFHRSVRTSRFDEIETVHDDRLTVTSEPGKGIAFSFQLPLLS